MLLTKKLNPSEYAASGLVAADVAGTAEVAAGVAAGGEAWCHDEAAGEVGEVAVAAL